MAVQFPVIPDVPGVPSLIRSIAFTLLAETPLTSDGPDVSSGAPTAQWGIYKDGQPVVEADSCVSLEYRKGWTISDYQTEGGGFESYDKVEEPYSAVVRMSAGGSEAKRNSFLQSIEAIAGDYNFYDVVMSDFTYPNGNITHFDFRRTNDQGVGLIQVDIHLQEMRTTGEAAFTSTKQPGSASQQNNGTVQTTPPSSQQQSILKEWGV